MRRRVRTIAALAAGLSVGAVVFAGPSSGCSSFVAEMALSAADFCFIFDCQNGILGGTIDPCPPADQNTGFPNFPPTGPVFVDCPDAANP